MAQAQQNARSYLIPAPTGGWNTRDPWYSMPESDAIVLDNVIPDTGFCRARGGYYAYASTGSSPFHTLAALSLASGTEKIVAVTGTDILDITSGGAGSSIKGAASITSGTYWQTTTFRNRLFLANGTDQPLDWTGTGNVTATAWTGNGLTITNLINVSCYKRRLYFVEKSSTKIWYTEAVDNVTGALTPFDVGSLLQFGGTVYFAGYTSTSSSISPSEQLFVIASSKGEILVYSGDNPLSNSWSLVGKYKVGPILGYRSGAYIGADLHLLSADGLIPMSQLMSGVDVRNEFQSLSGKIRKTFLSTSRATLSDTRWSVTPHPAANYIIVNVPGSYQYVMNTITGAWCRWTGLNAAVFCVCKISGEEVLLFGSYTTGKAYFADDFTIIDDQTTAISVDVQSSFNALGTQNADKIVDYLQPYCFAAARTATSADTQTIALGVGFDFRTIDPTDSPSASLLLADANATTEGMNNEPIIDSNGSGKFCAYRLSGDLEFQPGNECVLLHLFGLRIFYRAGSEIA